MLNLTMRKIVAVAAIFSVSSIYNANAQSYLSFPKPQSIPKPPEESKKFGVARHCVKITRDNEAVIFKNICEHKIYVIYCGDLKYSNRKCGDGSKGEYYTHGVNIHPNSSIRAVGKINWGACFGGIGFVNNKNYKDYPDGRYTCLR